jgi:hypothetical protein
MTRLGRKTRRLVRRSVSPAPTPRWLLLAKSEPLAVGAARYQIFEDEDENEYGPYGKQRLIAANSGLTVSTVSSPIFETRKLFPLIFP